MFFLAPKMQAGAYYAIYYLNRALLHCAQLSGSFILSLLGVGEMTFFLRYEFYQL